MGLPSSRRLKRHEEFARVKAEGHGQKGRFLVLNVLQTEEAMAARCGIITGKKTGNAVHRNLVRRRVREILRKECDRMVPGVWLVIIARWNAALASLEELKQDWERLATRARIIRNPADNTN